MNRLTRSIARACRENVLGEKWLVAPSYRTGNQWLECVARSGTPVVNVRVTTVPAMAILLAGPEMAARKVELLHAEAGPVLIDRAWARVTAAQAPEKTGYLSRLEQGPSLARTFHATVTDLRLAGVDASGVNPARFEVSAKGTEIAHLLEAWNHVLAESGLVDHADVLTMAAARLKADPACLPADLSLLLPADVDLNRLEQELLDAVPVDPLHVLPVDEPGAPLLEEEGDLTDAALLRHLPDPSVAPAPARDSTVRIVRAVGEGNEIREVLRACLDSGISLDEVEVLCTDAGAYIPLVFETFARLAGDAPGSDDLDTMPVTFAEGVPARYSRPGRALAGLVSWAREGFRQETLARMIQDGILLIPALRKPAPDDDAGKETESYATLARLFRSVPITLGRDRYLPGLEAAGARRIGADGGTLASFQTLHVLVEHLLALAPFPGAPQKEVLHQALRFLDDHVRCVTHLDNLALAKLRSRIHRLARLVAHEETAGIDVLSWLADLPRTVLVGGSGPRPGRLHVSGILTGGHSGRAHTTIVGLDDGRFPGGSGQDPLLLDGEREKVSACLPTADSHLDRKVKAFERLLARLRGSVTLSCSCQDVVEDREMFPSPLLTRVCRLLTGNPDAGLQHAPASFVPDRPAKCLDLTESWLHLLCDPGAVDLPEVVMNRHYPWISRGLSAVRERATDRFTRFDGHVGPVAPEDDPVARQGPVLSGSALETIATCPLAYFFSHVLAIHPLEEVEPDPNQWLDPAERGSLLHDVFHVFWHDLVEKEEVPSVVSHEAPLLALLHARVNEVRNNHPPGNEVVFQKEVKELEKTVRIFLQEEEAFAGVESTRPFCLEASVGMPSGPLPSPIDSREPELITLAPGKTIRVRGRIDRVDRVGAGDEFTVLDYKTGSSRRHEKLMGGTLQGRVIQHGLYLDIVQAVLMREVSVDARAVSFSYFFPGTKARGTRIVLAASDVMGWRATASALCDVVSRGCFLATQEADDCMFCDYKVVCGDLPGVHSASRRKIDNTRESSLDPIREVKRHG